MVSIFTRFAVICICVGTAPPGKNANGTFNVSKPWGGIPNKGTGGKQEAAEHGSPSRSINRRP
jgi:hypothetical protein